ncbi:MAG: argininosuccinate lyase [Myxococcota bacterium]
MSDQPIRGGRFTEGLAKIAAELNASHRFDRRLARFDVAQSQAHVRMLAARGLVGADEASQLVAGLEQVAREIAAGALVWRDELEDVHMHVEARLVELCGDAARKLQTGRSRNDQVATDLRLWSRDAAGRLVRLAQALRGAIAKQARATIDVLAPGYTHLQRAQPVRLAHHLLAHAEALGRDITRLRAASVAADVSPLGAGALASTSLPIDRDATARALGFGGGVTRNSLDAVGDRDFACDLVYACAITASHLSRLGEEIVLWSTAEFGFARPPEAYCSGSSLMPQKVNPDVAELVRAKAGRVAGDLVTLLVVLKGLPLAYNKDLQETQEPLYDAVETVALALEATTGLVAGLTFDEERLRAAASDDGLLATDLAERLVEKGAAFRDAHSQVGAWVRAAAERGVALRCLPELPGDLRAALDPAAAVERRDLVGGPARARVLAELARVESETKAP